MLETEFETIIKVLVVGNGAVGKSSMIQRYCKDLFTAEYKKTIGVDFLERSIIVNDEDVKLMLWDTAGQEEFDAITKAYYRGAHACVITFSTTDRDSFDAIESWKKKVECECGNIVMVLVQNKIDLVDQALTSPEEAETLAQRLKLRFYRTSVKDNLNVNDVFSHIATKCIKRFREAKTIHNSSTNTQKIGIFNTAGSRTGEVNEKDKPPPSSRTTSDTIQLRPTKQRTKGKKSLPGSGKCSLL